MSLRSNGSYIGPRPAGPSSSVASGIWDLRTAERQKRAAAWPMPSNGDAASWAARVTANSGTYDAATLTAVSNFCDSINAAGLRERFYRLNLLTGSDLNAALVPLYVGPVAGGTAYGNATDTNNNFISADYTLVGGLDGDGSTKYLETGLANDTLPSSTSGHCAAWKGAGSVGNGRGLIATRSTSDSHHFRVFVNGTTWLDTFWGEAVIANNGSNTTQDGFVLGSRTSSTSLKLYWNGSSVSSSSAATAPILGNNTWKVFSEYYGGAPKDFWPHAIKAYSIGTGLSDSDASAFYTALATFMTAIGR